MSKSIFDLFQEAITFKTTKSSLENCILFYFLNIFKSYLSFFIITLLSFIRKVLIPFDFNSNKQFPTNLFLVGKKKKSYQYLIRKLYSILFFKHFQVILNSSFLITTLLSFIIKILI